MFSWDETAFIEFLEVLPNVTDEFGHNYEFRITQQNTTLVLDVNADLGDCSVLLYSSGFNDPIFRSTYLGSPGARVVNDKHGKFIEIGAPGSYNGKYDATQPLDCGLRITISPHILVQAFGS